MSDSDADLDEAMKAAFRRARDGDDSLVARLGATPVSLPEEPGGTPPLVRPRSPEVSSSREGRYQLLGEIARGGVGVVLRGHDVDLGRDVAMKILRDEHRMNPDVIQRFVEEAQIGGQLQHPGIVPVYEMGERGDHCPFFTMKLIKGRTLADLLKERKHPGEERGRFLRIFEAVCQTMAYAHARHVIHRDLKPSNVMTGSFGEVLVVDWGLGKVLGKGGIEDEKRAHEEPQQSVIATVRSGSAGSESQVGSVMGTPAYMPPEQARGQVELVDERSDVFSLGAILCEILAGRPAYVGNELAKAAKAELGDAWAALDACDADPDLVRLAKSCLVPAVAARPRNAGVLAGEVGAHLLSLEERAKSAELAATEARVREVEERKRRKLSLALSAAVVAFLLLGGGGWIALDAQRRARADETSRVVAKAFDEATLLRGRAAGGTDVALWKEALGAARGAQALADARDADAALRAKVAEVLAAAAAGAAKAQSAADQKARDAALVARLEHLHDRIGDALDFAAGDKAYAAAFRDYGIDVDSMDEGAAAQALAAGDARVPLLLALDHWSRVRGRASKDRADGADRLRRIARAADSDAWRNRLRSANDAAALRSLAGETDIGSLPASSAAALAGALLRMDDGATAVKVLRTAVRSHPGDYPLNLMLGQSVSGTAGLAPALTDSAASIRHLTAALAIHPDGVEVRHQLAHALGFVGDFDESARIARDALALRPGDGHLMAHIALAHFETGRRAEALALVRDAAKASPDDAWVRHILSNVLGAGGDVAGAMAEAREAVRLAPDDAVYRRALGEALGRSGDLPGAVSELREAARLGPDYVEVHQSLVHALDLMGDAEGSAAACREVIRLAPTDSTAWLNLASGLIEMNDLDGAVAAAREAIRIDPALAEAHVNLGIALRMTGDADGAAAACREAIRLEPKLGQAHNLLCQTLIDAGDFDGAIAAGREAVRLMPPMGGTHCNLAMALARRGLHAEALVEFRRGHFLGSRQPGWPYPSARWVEDAERAAAFEARLPGVIAGTDEPADAAERAGFAHLAQLKSLHAAAAALFEKAFDDDPALAADVGQPHRYDAACSAARAGAGTCEDAATLDDAGRARRRRQAVAWLRADLAARGTQAQTDAKSARAALSWWKKDADLAVLRDAVEKLPADEQEPCRTLWRDVDALLAALP